SVTPVSVLRAPAFRFLFYCSSGAPPHPPSFPTRRSSDLAKAGWIEMLYKVVGSGLHALAARKSGDTLSVLGPIGKGFSMGPSTRSEEHTSELQSLTNLVSRLLLEKKNNNYTPSHPQHAHS